MKVSIITINYNNKCGLEKTINSVVRQTFRDYEFIVIDGGSTDGSKEIIYEYKSKIDYWVSEPDRGIYHAMNKGVKASHGEYLNFMNSGDCFYGKAVLQNIFTGNIQEDIVIGKAQTNARVIYPPQQPTLKHFYQHKSLNHQAAFIKRDLLIKYPYDETHYDIVSDTHFFVQAFIMGNCTYKALDEYVVNFDHNGIGSQNIKKNRYEQEKVLNNLISPRILEDYNNICMRYNENPFVRSTAYVVDWIYSGMKYIPLKRTVRKLSKLFSATVLSIIINKNIL